MTPGEQVLMEELIAELMKLPRALETYQDVLANERGRWVFSTHFRFVPDDVCTYQPC
jgi:hypothetical protein